MRSAVAVLLWVFSCVSLMACLFFAGCGAGQGGTQPLGVADYGVSGPYTHENLTVYLIHGKDKLPGKHFVTLTEAMEQKKVLVHDSKGVNTLEVENVSDEAVWVQSGDIVKGGRQDRTFANDCIIPPKSGKMDVAAFCVESGRWSQRGGESAGLFALNSSTVAGKELKMAVQSSVNSAQAAENQGSVWANVAKQQDKLSANLGSSANSDVSASSMQLTLEKKEVMKSTEGYIKAMEKIVADHPDAIGYAAAVNGKVSSIDVYANHELFAKLWPKLMNATAVEAVADYQKDKTFAAVSPADVKATMEEARKGKETANKTVANRAQLKARDGEKAMMVECYDSAAPSAAPVHESVLTH